MDRFEWNEPQGIKKLEGLSLVFEKLEDLERLDGFQTDWKSQVNEIRRLRKVP